MNLQNSALQLRRIVTRLPGRPAPASRGGQLVLLSALAALARRVRRLKPHRFTA